MRSVHTAHVMPDIRRSFVTILCCHVIRGLKGKDRMYAIVLRYKRPLSEVDKHVDAHRAWLRKNYADGTFLVSGRQRSGTGGFFFAPAIERGQLDAGLASDPFGQKNLADYKNIEVGPTIAGERLFFFFWKKKKIPSTPSLAT